MIGAIAGDIIGSRYEWNNIKTKEPLIPRYISTVDSGNFVGYLYVTKAYVQNIKNEELKNKLLMKSYNLKYLFILSVI